MTASQEPQMIRRAVVPRHRTRVEQGPHGPYRWVDGGMVTPVHQRRAGRGDVQAEDDAHGGRFSGSPRADEAGYDPRTGGERELVDRALVSVVLDQLAYLDHASNTAGREAWAHRS